MRLDSHAGNTGQREVVEWEPEDPVHVMIKRAIDETDNAKVSSLMLTADAPGYELVALPDRSRETPSRAEPFGSLAPSATRAATHCIWAGSRPDPPLLNKNQSSLEQMGLTLRRRSRKRRSRERLPK